MGLANKLRESLREAGKRLLAPPEPNDLGNRDVEHAWLISVLAAASPRAEMTALDVGGATSGVGLILSQLGYSTTVIDIRDLLPLHWHEGLTFLKGDFLEAAGALSGKQFSVITSISTVENMGLGRYGERKDLGADLVHMARCRALLKPGGALFLTTQVGRHKIVGGVHKIYGKKDMETLFSGFGVWREEYWAKLTRGNVWHKTSSGLAFGVDGNDHYYALGLFELRPDA